VVVDHIELSTLARDFLRASIHRDSHNRRRAFAILSTLLVIALVAAALAAVQRHEAEAGHRFAVARLLLNEAKDRLDQDPLAALRLAEAAVRVHPSPETRSALVNNVLTTPYTGTLIGQNGPVWEVAFAPNQPLLAAAYNGTVQLWDISDPATPTP
jgi:hypothetical protein